MSGALFNLQLAYPPAIRSTKDPQTAEADRDYSMTSPLEADGSNYPAKGYATREMFDKLKPVATLVAGQDFTWKTAGTATHNGGSCQVGISYDLLKTVAVMASYVGGCPLKGEYTFKVPDIPGAEKALFWWSWFNKSGNREMYNNAAVVAVTGKAKSFTGPTPFRANTFADGSCVTTEGKEWLFPNPGKQVFFAGEHEGKNPAPGGKIEGCSWDVESDVTVSSDGSSAPAPPKDDKPKDEKPKDEKPKEEKPKETDKPEETGKGGDKTETGEGATTATTTKPTGTAKTTASPTGTEATETSEKDTAEATSSTTDGSADSAVETGGASSGDVSGVSSTTFTPRASLADPSTLSNAQIIGGLLVGVLVIALLGVMFGLMLHHSHSKRSEARADEERRHLVKKRSQRMKHSKHRHKRSRSRSEHKKKRKNDTESSESSGSSD
ncbi:hypothetical protein ACM66B_002711 [Microbotryomycetes sp. NB124-2]